MDFAKMFRVEPGSKLNLAAVEPDVPEGAQDEAAADAQVDKYCARLRDLQYRLYAESKRSLLICLQGMDSAGKDGTITHVLGAMNPQGTRVCSFKVPSPKEAAHDFLWRIEKQVPAVGEVVIFNRSHYEDVLVVRVHNLVPKKVWSGRYDLINCFEENLFARGTHILKFFLHISPEEQLHRFKARLNDPDRWWKISEADYTERDLWPDYMRANEEALSRTSTSYAPWFVIPSNHKWFRNLAVSQIVVKKLESLGMKLPSPSVDIETIRRKYHTEAKR